MPFRMGPWEIALIVLVILIVFGVGKLPQAGGAIGKGLRAFRKGQAGEDVSESEEESGPPKTARKKASSRKSTSKS